jgi:putative peptidoglycan lipid II flippase
MALSLLSMFIGLLRDFLVVQRLGFSIYADTVVMVLLIPTLLENVIGLVAKDAAASAFAKVADRSRAEIQEFAARALILAVIVSVAISSAYVMSSEGLLSALTPGWSSESRESALVPFLLASAIVFFQTLVYFFIGYESVNSGFLAAAIRPLVLGIAGVSALVLSGEETAALAYVVAQGATLAGFSLYFCYGYQRAHLISLGNLKQSVPKVAALTSELVVVPAAILVVALQQFPFLLERIVSTSIGEGVPTLLSFVYRLVTVPQSLFVASIIAVYIPVILRARRSNSARLKNHLVSHGMFMTVFFGILSMTSFIAFSRDLGYLLGLAGIATVSVSASFQKVVLAYAVGLPAFFLSAYFIKIGIVLDCASKLVIPGLVAALLQSLFIWLFSGVLDAGGVALSSSIFFAIFCCLSAIGVRSSISFRLPISRTLRVVCSCFIACLTVMLMAPSSTVYSVVVKVCVYLSVFVIAMRIVGEQRLLQPAFWQSVVKGK